MIKIFDAHADIWNDVVNKRAQGEKHIILKYHLDKFKEGGVKAGIFVIWVDTPFDRPEKRFRDSLNAMLEELEENKEVLRPVLSMADFEKAKEHGQFPIVLGIEGFDGFEGKLEVLKEMHQLGFKHSSLTWNTENAFATGVKGNPERGLTELGVEAVKFMEANGMLIDVSHANEKTFWAIDQIATKPYIASHSNCKALCDVPRNLTDEQIKAIAKKGGVIGAVAYHDFISKEPHHQNIETYVNHIDHIVSLVGIDHVGFGFDFVDYLEDEAMSSFATEAGFTKDLENASHAKRIVEVLKGRGYGQEAIEKICSQNFLRVLGQII